MNLESRRPALRIVKRGDRESISVSSHGLCRFEPLTSATELVWLVQPAAPDIDLPAWLRNNRTVVADELRQHGALLFRGFELPSEATRVERFQDCVKALSGELLEYEYRSTPRTRVAGSIYTSTEYPPNRSIPLHNEMSYARAWPLKIWFHSVRVAPSGGQTPLADSRNVLARLSPKVRETFAERQVLYVRNYGHGVDLPWQEVFQTSERRDVEQFCRKVGMDFEWHDDDRLTTKHVCQAIAAHPQTGDAVWFNQAHLFHVTSLDDASRALLLQHFGESGLPRNAYYGDGSPIEPEVLDDIREAYERETVVFPWQAGDLLLVDNMRTAHGRQPFEGTRQVLAGMAERHGQADLCAEM